MSKRGSGKGRTPKERVLWQYPWAYADNNGKRHWHIFRGILTYRLTEQSSPTPRQAWADAARRLRATKQERPT